MSEAHGGSAPPGAGAMPAPPLRRRMASFVYEAMLLFGIALIPGVVGAVLFARTGQSQLGEAALRLFALLVYGAYFVWCWSTRGQTLAMQTWHIRVVTAAGERLTRSRALARFAACCVAWFAPATLVATSWHPSPWPSLALVGAGIAVYALLALAEPGRQFWHDRLCGTRLVDVRDEATAGSLRPRPR